MVHTSLIYVRSNIMCAITVILLLLWLLSAFTGWIYQLADMSLLTLQPWTRLHSDGLAKCLWFVFNSRSKWFSMFSSFQEGFGSWDLTWGEFAHRKHFWHATVGNLQVIIRKCWLYSIGLPDLVDVSSRLPRDTPGVILKVTNNTWSLTLKNYY